MSDHLDLRDVHGRHDPDPAFRLELRRQVEAIVRSQEIVPTTSAHSIGSNEEDLIMLTDTRSQPPQVSKRAPRWLLPAAAAVVVVAAVAAIAVAADDDDQTTVAGPRETRTIVEGMGTFAADSGALAGYILELSAIEIDREVSGVAEFRIAGAPPWRIELACTTVTGTDVIVGGEVSKSDSAERPVGTWAAVIVRDSPAFEDPTEVGLWFEDPAEHGSCAEFVAAIPGEATGPETLFPAFGDIEVG